MKNPKTYVSFLENLNEVKPEQPRISGATPTPSDQHEGQQMVPKMEGSPSEQIKLEHQVPQSQVNTSLGSAPDSLNLNTPISNESPTQSAAHAVSAASSLAAHTAAHSTAQAMTSLSSAMGSSQYPPYYNMQNDFYNNQLGLPGLTHLQTELEKKKRESPSAYQSVQPTTSSFAGRHTLR